MSLFTQFLDKSSPCSKSPASLRPLMILDQSVHVYLNQKFMTLILTWDSCRYIMPGAESKQPVGVPCYQWVGCRDHAGIICFPHSGSWQAQRGRLIYVETRENLFFIIWDLWNDSGESCWFNVKSLEYNFTLREQVGKGSEFLRTKWPLSLVSDLTSSSMLAFKQICEQSLGSLYVSVYLLEGTLTLIGNVQ